MLVLAFLTVLALTARLAAAPRAPRPGDHAGAAHHAPHERASGVAAIAEREPAPVEREPARAAEAMAAAVAVAVDEDVSDRDAQPDASACIGGSDDRAHDELTDGDRIVAFGDRDRSADEDAHLDATSPRAPPLLGRIDVSVGWRCWWAPTGAQATTHGELWLLGTWRL